jgi:hypothetical protein
VNFLPLSGFIWLHPFNHRGNRQPL